MIAFWWRNGILSSEWCVLLTSNNVSNTAWRWQQNIYFILWWVSKTTAFLGGCQRERNYRQRERNYYSEFDGLAFGWLGCQACHVCHIIINHVCHISHDNQNSRTTIAIVATERSHVKPLAIRFQQRGLLSDWLILLAYFVSVNLSRTTPR